MNTLVTYVTLDQRGEPLRSQRRAGGAQLVIGRGTNCQIQLPDSRVALEHARITIDQRSVTITAPAGRIRVNGRALESARLAPGDEIEAGPFHVHVDAPPTGVDLALTVRRPVAPASDEPARRLMLPPSQPSKRRLSYAAFIAVLLSMLGLPAGLDLLDHHGHTSDPAHGSGGAPAHSIADRFLKSWSPGAVSISHQVFGAQCHTCHESAFVEVFDQACLACHKDLRQHVPRAQLTGVHVTKLSQERCAACHPEHKGERTSVRAQQLCAVCHGDIRQMSVQAASGNVTDFGRDHPPFRLSLRDADHPEVVRRIRDDSTELVERSNFKFSHKVHLDQRGVRAPAGRKVMDCGDCHAPNEDGRRMAPISWARHCQSCHSLAFDPKRTDRQVPHGSVELVAATLQEFYSRMALGAGPADGSHPLSLRTRPGAVLSYEDRQRVLSIADAEARRAFDELFGKREVCTTCHVVQRIAQEPGWAVAAVRFTHAWMPRAEFAHAAHASTQCIGCHAVTDSQKAEDVAMPSIADCRECHVGSRPVLGKVTSDCATCHKFHGGGDLWQGPVEVQSTSRGAK
jgi:hypothetical protein